MTRSFYTYMRDEWKDLDEGEVQEVQWRRIQRWRDEPAINRVERPTRLDRARSIGYKAKQGVVVARTRVRKGSARKSRPPRGRRSKRTGTRKVTRNKNLQQVAEERTARKHPNLEVVGSYWVGEDGDRKWFEVVLYDPDHPAVENDTDLNWVCDASQTGRAYRGKTRAGQQGGNQG
ncbi:MAG: 50S ribosomal protein L15e [Halobacteriales archaeon]